MIRLILACVFTWSMLALIYYGYHKAKKKGYEVFI